MNVGEFLHLMLLVPRHYGIYFETRTNNIAQVSYIYIDKNSHNIILTDLPYSDYQNYECLKEN